MIAVDNVLIGVPIFYSVSEWQQKKRLIAISPKFGMVM